jgi:hypothetical protein
VKLLTDEQTQPVVLFFYCTKKYGHEWMKWAPEVLKRTLEVDHAGVLVAKKNLNKLLATGVVASTNSFFEDWEPFHFLTQALVLGVATAEAMQEHSIGEMMAAVDDAMYLREHISKLVPRPSFSDTVARYVAAQALNQSVWYLPAPLDFANDYAGMKRYRCRDCGHEGELLFGDTLCDVCTERFDTDSLREFKPNATLVKRGNGQNTQVFYKNPQEGVRSRLAALQKDPKTFSGTQDDVCAAKLLEAIDYVNHRRVRRDLEMRGLS